MATYTRTELRTRVLGRLGVVDATQAAGAHDATLADDSIQQTFEELDDEGLIPFDWEADEIPGAYFIALSYLCAVPMLADYGPASGPDAILAGAERGMRRLRRLKAQPYYGAPQRATYF